MFVDDDLDTRLAQLGHALDGAALQRGTDAAGDIFLQQARALVHVASGQTRDHLNMVSHHTDHSATSAVQVVNSAKGGEEHSAVFLEYGTQHMQARPFMRPAFETKKNEALHAFEQVLQAQLKAFS